MLKDSPRAYGRLTRTLHWLVAVLVVTQLSSVFVNAVWKDNAFSQAIFPWHTTIGGGVLILMTARTLWALSQRRQRPRHAGRLQRLAIGGHIVMYALLILMPLSGALMTWGMGYGVHVFGKAWFEGADAPWAASFGGLHGTFAWLLTLMIVGHVCMALYHHFRLRDGTLRRMLGPTPD
ncbi:MAG: cytochrome b [Salinicola sp.]|uniref:cytochrome b n=1 Tax=Salinicola sp. TaxID=1978524 RepID=UPI001D52E273|nr:cytochrome b [Salinicola sp.]NRB57217.1 cytochrome b [Salinicola sp.]